MFKANVRVVLSFCLFAITGLSFSGCSNKGNAPLTVTSVAKLSSQQAAVAHVHSLPLYHQAEQACAHKKYVQAARLLQRLSATPGLSSEQIAFCEEQYTICLKDAGLLPKSLSVRVAPAPVAAPRSAASADCGPRALALACRQLGVSASVADLRQWAGTTANGTSMAGLAKAAQKAGLKAEGVQVTQEGLAQIDTPAIAWTRRQHYAVITTVRGEGEGATATIQDPNEVKEETIPQESLLQLCGGYLLLLHR